MKPFSDKIVFVDAEFSDLEPYHGEIISIAMIKPSGEELYLELEHEGPLSTWVQEHLVAGLTESKVSRDVARARIRAFLGEEKPYMVAYVPQYDLVFLAKLFGAWDIPVYWLAVDFASILFADGIDPESYSERAEHQLARSLGVDVDQYRTHHALDDARMLKETWQRYWTQRAGRFI